MVRGQATQGWIAAQVSAFGSDSESDHLDNWEVHLLGSSPVWLRDDKVGCLVLCRLPISLNAPLKCKHSHGTEWPPHVV